MPATLADVLADPHSLGAHAPSPADLEQLRAGLDAAAVAATAIGGWSAPSPLRLSKAPLRWLLTCPRRAITPDIPGDETALVVGLIVDAAAKLVALGSARGIDVESSVAFLAAHGDTTVGEHLARIGPAASGDLLNDAGARIDALVAAWPNVEHSWWPRVEDPVRVRLADGAVTVAGRLDIVLGGPPGDRPTVVVEIKSGRWHDAMRADAHLYALLVGLRDRLSPAAVVTVVADGTTQVEPVRAASLVHAAERVEAALATAASLAAGEPAPARAGTHCRHCPARSTCPEGIAWMSHKDHDDDAHDPSDPSADGADGADARPHDEVSA